MPWYLWLFAALILLALLVWFLFDQTERIVPTAVTVPMPVTRPVRIVHISDLHCKKFSEDNGVLLDAILAQNPDLVCYTGDTANRGQHEDIAGACAFFARVQAQVPVVYIFGNHDVGSRTADTQERMLEAAGVTVLRNEYAEKTVNGQTLSFLGLAEAYLTDEQRTALLHGLEDKPGLRVLLSHFPENFSHDPDRRYCDFDVDLVLSGHAHGGQFILPLIGPVFSPGQGLFPKYARGVHTENGSTLVVSRGLGGKEFPFRLGNHPEVGLIVLEPKQS